MATFSAAYRTPRSRPTSAASASLEPSGRPPFGVYFVLPSRSALTHASTMFGAVGKSNSPM